MGLALVCDVCKQPALSAILFTTAQNPQGAGHICAKCLGERITKAREREDDPSRR